MHVARLCTRPRWHAFVDDAEGEALDVRLAIKQPGVEGSPCYVCVVFSLSVRGLRSEVRYTMFCVDMRRAYLRVECHHRYTRARNVEKIYRWNCAERKKMKVYKPQYQR